MTKAAATSKNVLEAKRRQASAMVEDNDFFGFPTAAKVP